MTNGISENALYVGLYLPGEEAPTTAALLKLERNNLQESGHLAYGLGYLARPDALALNPLHLPLQQETFRLPARLLRDGGALPLSIKDALPDAWGLRVLANELGGRLPSEREQLLLTNEDRVGAMVFSESRDMPAPAELPHDDLSQLADAVRRLQYDMDIPPPLKRLLLRGGSLGGARPKASFMHDDALWLAKFPAAGDPLDVQVLEATAHGLAMRCGIQVPQFMTMPVGRGENAFLSRRFDRLGERAQQRLHYLSASALLDIPYESSAGSYIEFARVIRRLSLRPGADLKELFRRLIFNLLIDNTDDHLKNHGMLWAGKDRYVLSPAFDVVPQLTNLGYQMLSIDGTTQESSLELAVQSAAHFDLSADQASAITKEMAGIVYGQWWLHAQLQDVPETLRKRLESCFGRQKEIIGAGQFGF
ncbi:type II toxin-antitoxin system HipA family toxin [Ferribacterium limneticum]|uniref:type II toxin-antitoxin system HipA family toxin n=1 Tax=Ferribacterium limneticum TaxID=76259 RepID=UPI001CFABCA8|nr:HipA domain-containing protein [Ferribacterium limneticum]UCV19989.1 HipA domain-containing protein [Ferribacterium limneticum]